jgi:rhodanese-related sulfurtransferase
MSKTIKAHNTYKTRTVKQSKAPCEVCSTRKLKGTAAIYKLKSGNTHLRQYLPKDDTPIKSTGSETVLLEGLKPNTTIIFFASNTPKTDFTAKITPFRKAYGHLENSGVGKTDNSGRITFKINCPRIYIAEDGEIYSRHIHWLYWNNKSNCWGNDIYTHQIFCNVDKAFVKKYATGKSSKVLIIDALSEESYNEHHIPGAINLPASKKWTLEQVNDILPKGTHSYTPMIIYCYSPECNAAEKLWEKLNRLGFYNTTHYSGGISDWIS